MENSSTQNSGTADAKVERDHIVAEYRQHLVSAEQKSQDDYDKAVVLLSGGALGVSFAFVKDIVGSGGVFVPSLLVCAWTLWALSAAAVLSSYFVSRLALRRTIRQCDQGTIFECKTPGEHFTWLLRCFNVISGLLFIIGVFAMCLFVYFNTPKERLHDRHPTSSSAESPTAAGPAAAETYQGVASGPPRSRVRAAADQALEAETSSTVVLAVAPGQRVQLEVRVQKDHSQQRLDFAVP